MKLLYIVNTPEFFLSHRLQLALAAREVGYEVHIATGPGVAIEKIKSLGFEHHYIPLTRSSINPFIEIKSILSLWILVARLKPDVLHLVTIKPVLYGGLISRLTNVSALVVAITGLGSVFVSNSSRMASWLRCGIVMFYRQALKHPRMKIIFQNPDDQRMFIRFGISQKDNSVLIRGSGVCLENYPFTREPIDIPVVTFASRLLREKGVVDFVEAAGILKHRCISSRFWLVGAPDLGNPSSISISDCERWRASGYVELLGYQFNTAEILSKSNLIVLPSYREGLPKVLMEAAAAGRAVITTDQPGCRYAIEPNITGLLVPVRDPKALADAIERLLKDNALRKSMGIAGRKLAEREFGIQKVVKAHLKIYKELAKN